LYNTRNMARMIDSVLGGPDREAPPSLTGTPVAASIAPSVIAGAPEFSQLDPAEARPDTPEAPAVDMDNPLRAGMAQMDEANQQLNEDVNVMKADLLASVERLEKLNNGLDYLEELARKKYNSLSENERMKINVQGERFEVNGKKAMKYTFFKFLFCEAFGTSADADGFYYIDRSSENFHTILNCIRYGADKVKLAKFEDELVLVQLRGEAEFYMMDDLVHAINRHIATLRAGAGVITLSFNTQRDVTHAYHGLVFEVDVRRPMTLHSISFLAAETRKAVVETYCRPGGLGAANQLTKLREVEITTSRGKPVVIDGLNTELPEGINTICVYSASTPLAVAVCPRAESNREHEVMVLAKSYCINEPRGVNARRYADEEFDFCGSFQISLREDDAPAS
jgi:hypothetical protein